METARNLAQKLIASKMACDERVPRAAIGYCEDLMHDEARPEIIADRLHMLKRYVPDLVAEYLKAE